MKGFFGAVVVVVVAVALLGVQLFGYLSAQNEYNANLGSFWNLSVKASTLEAKSEYLDKFVAAVEAAKLHGNDAVVYKTPDNSVEANINTLHTLQTRMHEVKAMDVTSFQYQQAISQITAQEQDEAGSLLGVIEGVWFLQNYPMYWDWYAVSYVCFLLLVLGVSGTSLIVVYQDYY